MSRKLSEPLRLPPEAESCKAAINQHSAEPPSCPCPKCEIGRQFRMHARAGRWFQMVVQGVVYCLLCCLVRWRCQHCGATFRHYPPGCVSYKRYLQPEIEARTRAYTAREQTSYRQVVRDKDQPVTYADPACDETASEAEKEAEEPPRRLAPSTVHRGLSWLVGAARTSQAGRFKPKKKMATRLRRLEEVVQRQQDGPDIQSFFVPESKYRSRYRRDVLVCCQRLLHALFVLRDFTDLATVYRPP